MTDALLTANGLSKSFGATRALQDVDLRLDPGERVAVLGENGAGKSTLMKVLAGVHPPDEGAMTFLGQEYAPQSPAAALAAGISIVFQEPTFFGQLSVLENIFVGQEVRDRWGSLRWKAMRSEARALFQRLGLPERLLDRDMESLSLGNQQLVLIARAIHQDARVLILDEPTSILTDAEATKLFELVDQLSAGGGGVLYISHRLRELERVADRLVVLKDGRLVGEMTTSDASEDELIQLMSGRHVEQMADRTGARRGGKPLLEVAGLTKEGVFRDISFDVARGEILGFYGLVGSGRTEVALAVFGALRPDAGTITLDGRKLSSSSPAAAIASGIAYVPEDRKTQGIFPLMDTGSNLSAAALASLSKLTVVNRGREDALVRGFFDRLEIKVRRPSESILNLSGGSQQKVVLARWLATDPRVLILDEPTRGIDVGTKAQIHELIRDMAERGLAVILISSELPELLALSDRVNVLHEGTLTARLEGEAATEDEVLRATMGMSGDGS